MLLADDVGVYPTDLLAEHQLLCSLHAHGEVFGVAAVVGPSEHLDYLRIHSWKYRHLSFVLPVPREVTVEPRDERLGVAFCGKGTVGGHLPSDALEQLPVAFVPPVAPAERVPVRGVKAQHRGRRRDLIDIHGVDTVFREQPYDNLVHLVLPQFGRWAHHGKPHGTSVLLFAAIHFAVRVAVLVFCGGSPGYRAELVVLHTPVARIPQAPVDIGHHKHARFPEALHTFREARLDREVVGVVVIKRNLMPVVPVETNRHTAVLRELLHRRYDLLRTAACQ